MGGGSGRRFWEAKAEARRGVCSFVRSHAEAQHSYSGGRNRMQSEDEARQQRLLFTCTGRCEECGCKGELEFQAEA
jgi:hypothetical protein